MHELVDSTLVMLSAKIGSGVQVVKEYDRSLPRIPVYPGELNQVWTNLIDNAVSAMGGEGRLTEPAGAVRPGRHAFPGTSAIDRAAEHRGTAGAVMTLPAGNRPAPLSAAKRTSTPRARSARSRTSWSGASTAEQATW